MPVCNMCGVELIAPDNWSLGSAARKAYRCRPCASAVSTAYNKAHPDRIQVNRRSIKHKYSLLCSRVKIEGLNFGMSLEEYTDLVSPNSCFYCTGPLPEQGVGLDQRVPGAGYTMTNVVPCCGPCNWLKGDEYSVAEMQRLGPFAKSLRDMRNGAPPGSPLSSYPVTYEDIDRLFAYLHTGERKRHVRYYLKS